MVLICSASIEDCKRNIKFNGASATSKVEAYLVDARIHMLTHPKEFDVVRHSREKKIFLNLTFCYPYSF
jgi:hypothetical protein